MVAALASTGGLAVEPIVTDSATGVPAGEWLRPTTAAGTTCPALGPVPAQSGRSPASSKRIR
jgi:hypothetical protein